MAAPSIDAACIALAEVVGSIEGLRAKGYADDVVNPPEAQVFSRPFDPRLTLGGSPKRMFQLGVRVFVKRTNPRSAQLALRGYMEPTGSTSVLAKINDGDSWTETIDYAEVTSIGQPFEFLSAESEVFLAVDFDVDVTW